MCSNPHMWCMMCSVSLSVVVLLHYMYRKCSISLALQFCKQWSHWSAPALFPYLPRTCSERSCYDRLVNSLSVGAVHLLGFARFPGKLYCFAYLRACADQNIRWVPWFYPYFSVTWAPSSLRWVPWSFPCFAVTRAPSSLSRFYLIHSHLAGK